MIVLFQNILAGITLFGQPSVDAVMVTIFIQYTTLTLILFSKASVTQETVILVCHAAQTEIFNY